MGLLVEIIREEKYQHLTNLMRQQEIEPGTYDPDITDTTATHKSKRMEQEWARKQETWAYQEGVALRCCG
jgi:hypothetical protein